MPQYDDTNRGVLFKNDKKGNDSAPDYTGKIDVEGKPYRLAAWIKEGRSGKFMSLSLTEPREGSSSAPPAGDLSDTIPFAPHRGL